MGKTTIYTLCVNNYEPQIRELTFPLLRHYANKIDADFQVITERKYPEWPITFEKFQTAEKALERGDDWAIFFDADTLVDPEMFDITEHVGKETVLHNGNDFAPIRWRANNWFRRDGRQIGSCTWCVIASDWTVEDLWFKPPSEIVECWGLNKNDKRCENGRLANGTQCPICQGKGQIQRIQREIFRTVGEHNSTGYSNPLIDDYLLSCNIARFGLKFKTIGDVCAERGIHGPNGQKVSPWLYHLYTIPNDVKVKRMLAVLSTARDAPAFEEPVQNVREAGGQLIGQTRDGRTIAGCGRGWGLMSLEQANQFRQKWNIR